MSTERARRLASFFGTFMVLVQLRLLWIFGAAFLDEVRDVHWIPAAELYDRIAWLRPAWLGPGRLAFFVWGFFALGLLTVLGLWILGLLGWARAWRRRGDG